MALAVSRLTRRAVPFSRNYRYVVRAYNSWRVGDDSLKKKLRTGIGILTAGSLIFILTQKYSRVNVVHALKSRKREKDLNIALVRLTGRTHT
uniref:Uncharacterized protein n=1 Tax=Vespula pensylvanica TaxID=30213 RepID=A0A834JKA6_VESPE|nr:hypothetical protein H0235_017996 [Vespula pensylvanica]